MDKRFTQFWFESQEHPTSTKYNNILNILEEMRRHTGPISIAVAASGTHDASNYTIRLAEDPRYLGGIVPSGGSGNPMTRRSFTVEYHVVSGYGTSDDYYARWTNVPFISGGSDMGNVWYANLDSEYLDSGVLGAGYIDLSVATISSFTCMMEPVTTGYNRY